MIYEPCELINHSTVSYSAIPFFFLQTITANYNERKIKIDLA